MIVPGMHRTLERLLASLNYVKRIADTEWSAECPAHESEFARSRTLRIRLGDDGRVLIGCVRGCSMPALASGTGIRRDQLHDLRQLELEVDAIK